MKNILLAVCGLSPQVITETLYAIHQSGRRVDAVHVITTREGRDRIFSSLLAERQGHFHRYLAEYGFGPHDIAFDASTIHGITRDDGRELTDIIDERDNEATLRTCLERTFDLTRNPDAAVFFSVAGGRKTMSACLAVAAQMYSRPQDRIYHVLVSPEFENSPEFFYPPKASRAIPLVDAAGQPYYKETRYAKVNLVHLPFVSIRNRLSDRLLTRPMDPATLMLSLVREDQNRLTVHLLQGKLVYRGLELDLMPARMALYAFFALHKKDCALSSTDCRDCDDCFMDIHQLFAAQKRITDLYKKLCGARPIEEMSDTGITNLNADNFNSYKGKIRKDLLDRFGPYALNDLEIASRGKRPNTRYGLVIDRNRIEVIL